MRYRRLALLGTLSLMGCQTTTPASGIDPRAVACGAFEPITYSRRDTLPTIKQVRQHNAAYDVTCPDKNRRP
jgi:hypothetical protein